MKAVAAVVAETLEVGARGELPYAREGAESEEPAIGYAFMHSIAGSSSFERLVPAVNDLQVEAHGRAVCMPRAGPLEPFQPSPAAYEGRKRLIICLERSVVLQSSLRARPQ